MKTNKTFLDPNPEQSIKFNHNKPQNQDLKIAEESCLYASLSKKVS